MNTQGNGTRPSRLPILIGAVFFIGLVGLLLYGVINSDRPDRDALPSPLIGKPAPDFSLPVLHDPNYKVTKKDLLGAPYVLNVWGSWCPECRVEHPVLSEFAMKKRVRVIGYNLKDEPADALKWLEKFGNPYIVVLTDADGGTAINWGIYGAPETFLVDARGIVRWKHVGALDNAIIASQLIPMLEKLEAGK